jgi:hypothetical protein
MATRGLLQRVCEYRQMLAHMPVESFALIANERPTMPATLSAFKLSDA